MIFNDFISADLSDSIVSRRPSRNPRHKKITFQQIGFHWNAKKKHVFLTLCFGFRFHLCVNFATGTNLNCFWIENYNFHLDSNRFFFFFLGSREKTLFFSLSMNSGKEFTVAWCENLKNLFCFRIVLDLLSRQKFFPYSPFHCRSTERNKEAVESKSREKRNNQRKECRYRCED